MNPYGLQEMVDAICRVKRDEALKHSAQLTIGELIAKLESCRLDDAVVFDFDNMHPTGIGSWRGAYEELAMGYDDKGEVGTVAIVLGWLTNAIGRTFEGYKGGSYIMGKRTPVWADNYGVGGHRGIIGVRENATGVVLLTATCEF